LASRFRQAAGDLLGLLEKNGDTVRAADVARRVVDLQPLNEEFQQALMRTLAAAGRPAEAVRQYHEFERLLDAELGQVPQPATRGLVRRIEDEVAEVARAASPSAAVPAAG